MKRLLWGILAVLEMVVAIPLAYPALLNALMIARTRSSVFTPNRAYFFGMVFGDFLRIVPACLLLWHATVITRTLVVSRSVPTDPPPSRLDMRALNVIGILLAAPVVGFLLGAFGFGLTLPRHPAPGDGIGVMLSGFVTAVAFFAISIPVAAKISQKPSPEPPPQNDRQR